jgi:hypothetical protein
VYGLFFDNSMLADDAAWEADRGRRTTTFTQALQNMKILAQASGARTRWDDGRKSPEPQQLTERHGGLGGSENSGVTTARPS